MFGSRVSQLQMANACSSQNISCLARENKRCSFCVSLKKVCWNIFISMGFKLELLLVCREIKYTFLFRVIFKQMYSFRQMFILRFSLAEKCLKYFLNWGNRSLPLEPVSSAIYQIQREVQKAISLDNEVESFDASSEQITK